MRIIALADVHGRFAAVAEVLRRTAPADVAVIAGDLTHGGLPADVERAIALWRPLVPRLFAVAGNMDSAAIDAALERLGVSLNGCCQRVGPVGFFGCSGAPVGIGTPYELPESELAARAERGWAQAQGAAQLVFVPHAPPRGAVDRTSTGKAVGSTAVRALVDRVQPALVLCGHIHEARGTARLGGSWVVNCGAAAAGHYAVIELSEHAGRVELK